MTCAGFWPSVPSKVNQFHLWLAAMLFNNWAEFAIIAERLSLFYKQRDNLFYPRCMLVPQLAHSKWLVQLTPRQLAVAKPSSSSCPPAHTTLRHLLLQTVEDGSGLGGIQSRRPRLPEPC